MIYDYNKTLSNIWDNPSLLQPLMPEYLFKNSGDTLEGFDHSDIIRPVNECMKLNSYWIPDKDRKYYSYTYDIPGIPKEKVGVDVDHHGWVIAWQREIKGDPARRPSLHVFPAKFELFVKIGWIKLWF